MLIPSLLFFLSGFAALVYEVLWFRELGLVFGNTVHAATTVTFVYMTGLGLGARAGGRLSSRIANGVRAFGIIEFCVGLFALCVPFLLKFVTWTYCAAYQGDIALNLTLLRFALSICILLVPTFLMGATLPMLIKSLAATKSHFGRRFGWLYGINTLGAVSGTILTPFLLIPAYGIHATAWIAISTNMGVGLIAFAYSALVQPASQTEKPQDQSNREIGNPSGIPLLLAGLSGFTALALEVVWFRSLILIFGSTTYSFSVMLSVFLAAIAIGSAIAGPICDRFLKPLTLYAMAAIALAIYVLMSISWFTDMPEALLHYLLSTGFNWYNLLTAKFAIAAVFLAFPAICLGCALTSASREYRNSCASSPRATGRVYMSNTIGAGLGAVAGGFLLLPSLGLQNSLTALGVLALGAGIAALVWIRRTALVCAAATLAAGVAVVLILITPQWNPKHLSSGVYFSPGSFIRNGKVAYREKLASERLLFFEEAIVSTISVIRSSDESLVFSFNGEPVADTHDRSMMNQEMMGHLPMLFHENPRRVLNIGLGAGVTLGALSCYPLDELEVVEIEPATSKATALWSDWNHDVLNYTNLVVTINDARNHLLASDSLYDVITSDPFKPAMAGSAHLYTVEHFERSRARLADGGVMAQYLPLYKVSKVGYESILKSFATVFPDNMVFYVGIDSILLGFKDGLPVNFETLRSKSASSKVDSALNSVGFSNSLDVAGILVGSVSPSDFPDAIPLNTDSRPYVEFSAPKYAVAETVKSNQETLARLFNANALSSFSDLGQQMSSRLTDSRQGLRLTLQANVLRDRKQTGKAIELLAEAIKLAPHNPVVRNELVDTIMQSAGVMREGGVPSQAFAQYQLALKFNPSEFDALFQLVQLAMLSGQHENAQQWLEQALAYYPESPYMIGLRGKVRFVLGDTEGACSDLEKASGILPYSEDLLSNYYNALKKAGREIEAERAKERLDSISGAL